MKNFDLKIVNILFIALSLSMYSQIGMNTTSPRGALDINSPTTNNKGLVLPTNENPQNIINPMGGSVAIGTIIYDSTLNCVRVFRLSGWSNCLCDECSPTPPFFKLNCDGGTLTGIYKAGISSSGNKIINYTGGQGQSYGEIIVFSTGVTGLKATAPAGQLANNNGSITLDISGIPSNIGTATFTITINEVVCSFKVEVTDGNAFALKCGEAQFFGQTSIGAPSTGLLRIPYTNGDGSSYPGGQYFFSSGVTGLKAISNSAVLDNNDPLDFTVSGTASNQGYAIFDINILNSTCTVKVIVPNQNN